MMVRVFPYGAVQFVSYEKFNQVLNNVCENCSISKLVAGSLAGTAVNITSQPFQPTKFANIYLLLTISIQNKINYCKNIGIDHTFNMKKKIHPK